MCFLSQIDRLKQQQDQNLSRYNEYVRNGEASLQQLQAQITSLQQEITRRDSIIRSKEEEINALKEPEDLEVSGFVEHLIYLPIKRHQIVSRAFSTSGSRVGYDFHAPNG